MNEDETYELEDDSSSYGHWKIIQAASLATEITPQGHENIPGINDRTAGSTQIAANLVVMTPGIKAKGHVHKDHENYYLYPRGIRRYLHGFGYGANHAGAR